MTYIAADQDIAEQLHGPFQLPAASNPGCEEEPNAVQLPSARGHSNWPVRDIIAHFWPQRDPGKLRDGWTLRSGLSVKPETPRARARPRSAGHITLEV